ncbi:sensor histidine kinase [Actinomycetospora termitidis]|uniref:histidine kinase n=1 Tax=Actinomycetospora termitidis TaxID=3053470 RepID=A0ABT7MC57_9PSEU|nr:histidine kinase [Actinomycetospora sp. Odt1-22]MDL5158245.1 histidine kinase [Actinomycetospora sp. Odt1-22]
MIRTVRDVLPRPWWWDAGIALLTVAVGVASMSLVPVRFAVDVPPAAPWVRLALVVAVAAPQLLRTRRPGLALVLVVPLAAADVAAGFSPASALALWDLLYCAVLHGSAAVSRRAQRAGPALYALALAGLALAGTSTALLVASAFTGAGLLLLPVWWAAEVRRPTREALASREAAEQAARIAALDRRAAVADERARIARELHDSVAGHLAAIALQSQAALRTAEPAARERVLGSVRENSVRALDEMRALIGVLRTGADAAEGPSPTAPRLADLPALVESARAGGLDVEVDGVLAPGGVPGPVDLTAYRIVQEALTNVSVHAPGATVRVAVGREGGDVLLLEVINSLAAGSSGPHVGAGSGVEGMKVRAAAVGGELEAGRDEDRWRVVARLPLGGVAP